MDSVGLADQTELFIALVAAVGTDAGMISEEVGIELAEYGYAAHPLRLSEYLAGALPSGEEAWGCEGRSW